MHHDARLTLWGSVVSGVLVIAVATVCDGSLWLRSTAATTGAALTASGLAIALAIDHYHAPE